MRLRPIVLSVLLACAAPAMAQVGFSFNSPGISIGINLPAYPTLQRVPGYPVYYAPSVNTNYFFYDGLYWVYASDNWYASSWYNGPWHAVDRFYVPEYILRVPVRYYRHAPAYFHGWRADAAPHWGEHWGSSWAQKRYGWDRWNRSSAPAPAPLPTYQRQYSGSRYPQVTEKATIVVDDVNADPRYLACSIETKSEIVVPIMRGSQPLGEIDIDSDRPAAFDDRDRALLEPVAAMLADRFDED